MKKLKNQNVIFHYKNGRIEKAEIKQELTDYYSCVNITNFPFCIDKKSIEKITTIK